MAYTDVNLMVVSEQAKDTKSKLNIEKQQVELAKHLQNNTYALSDKMVLDMCEQHLLKANRHIKKIDMVDVYTNEKIQMRIDQVEQADYKIMVFTVVESLGILMCSVVQVKVISKLLLGKSIL